MPGDVQRLLCVCCRRHGKDGCSSRICWHLERMSDDVNKRNQLTRYAILLNKLTETTAAIITLLDSRVLSISGPTFVL